MQKSNYPKITIITPSFNQGHFIKETIDSVLKQKYPNLEYWVIDGGSTDDTVKILKSYGKKIQWVSEKDSGQTHAINKGLARSTGDIIAYLNSDDVFLPNTLFTVAGYFVGHPDAQWLTGDYYIIDEKGTKIQSFVVEYKKLLRMFSSFTLLSIANYIIQPSTFWRADVVKKIGTFNQKLRYCMDFDYWMRLYQRYPLHVVDTPFSLFRIHAASKGGSQYIKQFAEEHDVVQKYMPSSLVLLLHKLHSSAIVVAYKLLK